MTQVDVGTTPVSVVEPTVTAAEIQAGAPVAVVNPSLPEEITVAMPEAFSVWTDVARVSVSQVLVNWPPPMLTFTAAIGNAPRLAAM
jgi:hypothetical protein